MTSLLHTWSTYLLCTPFFPSPPFKAFCSQYTHKSPGTSTSAAPKQVEPLGSLSSPKKWKGHPFSKQEDIQKGKYRGIRTFLIKSLRLIFLSKRNQKEQAGNKEKQLCPLSIYSPDLKPQISACPSCPFLLKNFQSLPTIVRVKSKILSVGR